MTTSLTPRNQNPALSPSSSSSSAGPVRRVSICSGMSQPRNTLGDHVGASMSSHQTSEYSTQSSSSAHPLTPLANHNSITTSMADPTMSFGNDWPVPNFQDSLTYDLAYWMADSGKLLSDVAVSWKPAPERKPDIHGVLSMVETLIPQTSTSDIGSNAAATAPLQVKRPRSRQGHDDNNQHERKRNAPADAHRRTGRPQAIHYEMRELKDEDFEYSCEWCPFFIYQPFKFDTKPWNSCAKQRAESSHIVTHMVADHGIIRGHNTKRATQRYLTTCAMHDYDNKGKAECTLCQKVQTWTPEQQFDPSHAGKSVCLRCYEELPNKMALYNHLQERSICLYKEDLPMRRKARILYTAFCSSTDVPRFNPPPESGPRDGARKRNMKGTKSRTNNPSPARRNNQARPPQPFISSAPKTPAKPIRQPARQPAQQSAQQPAQPPTPQSAPSWSPSTGGVSFHSSSSSSSSRAIKSELGGDISANYFQPAPTTRSPFTQPAPQFLINRQPVPSNYSTEFDFNPPAFSMPCQDYCHLPLTQDDPGPGLVANSAVAPQQSPGMQAGGLIMGKQRMYPPTYDSAYGSQSGERFQALPFEEDLSFSPNYIPRLDNAQLVNHTGWR